jgi:hypothetical protein
MYDDVTNFASTRIRLYYPNNSINQYHKDKYESSIGFNITSDVLIIQKKITSQTLLYVECFEGLVIFDFDDPVHDQSLFNDFIKHVDIVTTDTLGRKEHFDSLKTGKDCFVIEDCLDYGIVDLYDTPDFTNNVVWFGNYPNITSIEWAIPSVLDFGFNLNLITQGKSVLVQNKVKINEWNLNTFVNDLRKSNICLLSHKGSDSGVKSNNKMIVSIACGIPCIVNESRSYEELAKKFNLDYCIVSDVKSLKSSLKMLNDKEKRKEYLKDVQPFIINSLSTKVITEKLINLIEEHA